VSRPHPVLSAVAARRDSPPVTDGDALLASVHEHRMTGAVAGAQARGELDLPEELATTLGIWELGEERDHRRFWRTIADVQGRLATTGVEVAVLKGVATEARWYDRIGERVATDVDLLLDPAAIDDAAEIVGLLDPGRGGTDAIRQAARLRWLQHVDLRVGDVQVDLHLDPLKIGVPTRQLQDVWDTTEQLVTPHGSVRVLRPEVELVLLLLHLNKDAFSLLGPFLDIGNLLARHDIDWSLMRRFVATEGLEVPVYESLALVTSVLDLEFPREAPRSDGPRTLSWRRIWRSGRQLRGQQGRERAPSSQRLLAMHVRRRGSAVARELRRQLLPPRSLLEVAGRLPAGGSYVRYLLHDRPRARADGQPADPSEVAWFTGAGAPTGRRAGRRGSERERGGDG
jgi:hypothetical protein